MSTQRNDNLVNEMTTTSTEENNGKKLVFIPNEQLQDSYEFPSEEENSENHTETSESTMEIFENPDDQLVIRCFKIIMPEAQKRGFDNIFGLQKCKDELKNILHFLKNPELYSKRGITPYCKYLLVGEEGVGKKALVSALAKEANLPLIEVEPWIFCCQEQASEEIDSLFAYVQELCSKHSNCILLFKDIDYSSQVREEEFFPVLEKFLWHIKQMPQLIAFATISSEDEKLDLSKAFLDKGAFSKALFLPNPELEVRREIIKFLLKGTPLAKDFSFDKAARYTLGLTFGEIKLLLKDATLLSLQNHKEKLNFKDFSEAILSSEFGTTRAKLSEEERLATARHEAGHVVAQYFASGGKTIAREVEVNCRDFTLGLTTKTPDEKKFSYFKADLEQEIIGCFGGMASETIFYGSNTIGVAKDLVMATALATDMCKNYGMFDTIGPVALSTQPSLLPTLNKLADAEIHKYLRDIYQRTVELLKKHFSALEELSQRLYEKEVLEMKEIKEILEKHNK